jgi:hypothetical protein
MDRVRLSSSLTPVYKYVIPLTLSLLLSTFLLVPGIRLRPSNDIALLAVFAVFLGESLVIALRLKTVEMDLDSLYVRTAGSEVSSRLDNIVEVNERWLLAPGLVRVKFRSPTSFGSTLVFLARGKGLFGPSEATEDLRARAGLL